MTSHILATIAGAVIIASAAAAPASAQIYGQHDNRTWIMQPPPPQPSGDWRQFVPGQMQPPPPRQQVCHFDGGYLICE